MIVSVDSPSLRFERSMSTSAGTVVSVDSPTLRFERRTATIFSVDSLTHSSF